MTRRIALVCDYSLGMLGGAETAFVEQAQALAKDNEVIVITPSCEEATDLDKTPNVRVYQVRSRLTLPALEMPMIRNSSRLRRRLRPVLAEVDIVHVHTELGLAAACVDVASELNLPIVHTVHTFFWQTKWPVQTLLKVGFKWFHKVMNGWTLPQEELAEQPGDSALRNMTLNLARRADRVISPSAHQAERLAAAGVERVDLIANTFASAPDAEPVSEISEPLVLMWLGRMVPEKRIIPFVEACRRVIDELGSDSLIVEVLGDGEQFEDAKKLCADYDQIRLHGRVTHEIVMNELRLAHVTALTSYQWDNQPMVVVESIMALRPVLYCDPELQEGLDQAGILAESHTVEGLAAAIKHLVLHPEAVIEKSRACLEAREVFGTAGFLKSVEECYAKAELAASDATGQ